MALAPKPIKLTAATTAAPAEPAFQPQPFIVYGGVPTATATVAGGVLKAADVPAASGGTDTATQTTVNAILTSLKAAGIMA